MFNFATEQTNTNFDMSRYFSVLSWLILAAIVSVGIWIAPVACGWPIVVGMCLAAMASMGMVSWQYHKDTRPDKDWKWRKNYFRKDYYLECVVQSTLFLLSVIIALVFWNGFCFFFTGAFSVFWLNIVVETVWAVTHPQYNR